MPICGQTLERVSRFGQPLERVPILVNHWRLCPYLVTHWRGCTDLFGQPLERVHKYGQPLERVHRFGQPLERVPDLDKQTMERMSRVSYKTFITGSNEHLDYYAIYSFQQILCAWCTIQHMMLSIYTMGLGRLYHVPSSRYYGLGIL